jgi:hypothetical protein
MHGVKAADMGGILSTYKTGSRLTPPVQLAAAIAANLAREAIGNGFCYQRDRGERE